MMNTLRILLKEGLVIFILFTLGRLLFILNYADFNSLGDIWNIFIHALPLDISTIVECLLITYLSLLLRPLLSGQVSFMISKYYSIGLAIIISMLYAGEIVTYEEWGTKLNYKIFIHLSHPAEIFQTSNGYLMLKYGLIMSFMLAVYTVMRRSAFMGFTQLKEAISSPLINRKAMALSAVQYVALAPILIIIMRGGIQPVPINLSSAYYTDNAIHNDAAVNSLWNLGHSMIENFGNFDNHNPFKVQDDTSAQKVVDKIYLPVALVNDITDSLKSTTPISIFKTERPNIVLLILESWSANVIACMNGPASVTPNFDRLAKDGLLFTQFHASGYTSDLAMPAIFSSFHALPIASIVTQPSKVKHLPSLAGTLNASGYNTSFYYGGALIYGNIKSYLQIQGFNTIVEESNLDTDLPRGKLGVHDEYMFQLHGEELVKASGKKPFFSTLYTLSSHPPYDMPITVSKKFDTKYNEYLNSIWYTDSCLGAYFSWIREQEFYDNTIFIITSDHGHYSPKSSNKFSKVFNNIPLLFFGKPLKDSLRGTLINKLCSQVDIAPTLLGQLNIPFGDFKWGKDILNPNTPEFAYYSGPNSISWIRPYGYFTFENRYKEYLFLEVKDSSKKELLIREGKAYAQLVFQDYLDY